MTLDHVQLLPSRSDVGHFVCHTFDVQSLIDTIINLIDLLFYLLFVLSFCDNFSSNFHFRFQQPFSEISHWHAKQVAHLLGTCCTKGKARLVSCHDICVRTPPTGIVWQNGLIRVPLLLEDEVSKVKNRRNSLADCCNNHSN